MQHLIKIILLQVFLYTGNILIAQVDKFERPGSIGDIHTLYTYRKSNWDGSNSSYVYLYIKDSNNLESFKWSKGVTRASLVSAWLDWNNFAVNRMTNHQVDAEGGRNLFAQLEISDGKKLKMILGPFTDSMTLASTFWHSYDFDFSSLGFIWRGLKNKKSDFDFLRVDPGMIDQKPAFINKGVVKVKYIGTEKKGDKSLYKYEIDGDGLDHKGGFIWIDGEDFMIERFKIQSPDEDGFQNNLVQLISIEKLNPMAWNAFIKAKMESR